MCPNKWRETVELAENFEYRCGQFSAEAAEPRPEGYQEGSPQDWFATKLEGLPQL